LFFNFLGYGITDNISINAGFDFMSLFERSSDYNQKEQPVLFIMPKIDFQVADKLRLGTSFLYIRDNGYYFDNTLGVQFANCTYGQEDRNISLNVGYNFLNESDNDNEIIFTIGSIYRVSNRIAVEFEYDHFTEDFDEDIIGYGCKFISRKMSVDFGFINNTLIFQDFILGIPFISLTLKV
jgi:hypothetical protein